MKILFSNLGYAKGIGGDLRTHAKRAFRHVYQTQNMQLKVLTQFRAIIEREKPDVCCMVELDQGSLHSSYFNQIKALMCEEYCVHDITGKYGEQSPLSRLPFHRGKSNAFIARQPYAFTHRYFSHGSKRLIYQITLRENLTLFFTHFSLKKHVRQQQFAEIIAFMTETPGEHLLLADFNILNGPGELEIFYRHGYRLLNKPDEPTFTFHRWRHMLDLCLSSSGVGGGTLQIIPQPFSDHAALLLELE